MGFIYKVTNKINGKVYIGQSIFVPEKRLKEHFRDARSAKYSSRPFYNAINKYGTDNFFIETIEEVDNDKLNEREKYWIRYYNSFIHFENAAGYNATLGGDSTLTKDYEAIAMNYQITGSKQQTATNMGCCVETVRRALESLKIKTINQDAGRSIQRIDINGNIQCYDSIRQAAFEIAEKENRNFQTVRKRINAVILNKPGQKAYGYFWKQGE